MRKGCVTKNTGCVLERDVAKQGKNVEFFLFLGEKKNIELNEWMNEVEQIWTVV